MSEEDAAEAVPDGLVAGKYRLTRLLGRGGMGSVWEGVHESLDTRVAVKFIDAGYAESSEARTRFENEARAAARLRSKHVVDVYDHGVLDDGRQYIVMEFLEGEALDARLDRLGRLSAQETASILAQVCRALTNAHSVGIVHRDLKPENIFLVWDSEDQKDVVRVVDFGIAKFTDSVSGVSSSTRTGSLLGTPFFMSPEQSRGLRSVDHRTDLWSVGVIAYRCVVGSLPFDGEAVGDLLVNICTGPIPVPSQVASDLPPRFDDWFARALTRDPAERFQSAQELSDALAEVCGVPALSAPLSSGAAAPHPTNLSGQPVVASSRTEAPLTNTVAGSRPRRWFALWAVVALVVLGGAGLAVALWGGGSEGSTVAQAEAEDAGPALAASALPSGAELPVAEVGSGQPKSDSPEAEARSAPGSAPEAASGREPADADAATPTGVSKPKLHRPPAPKPRVAPKSPPTPKPAPEPAPKPGQIDLGY